MRRIGFLFCLLLAACGGASPAEQPAASPVAGATASPAASSSPSAAPPPADPDDGAPPADAPGDPVAGAFVWTRQEAASVGVIVATLRYMPGMGGGEIMGDGWFDNQGAAPVSMADIGIAVADGAGRRVEGRAHAFDGQKGSDIAAGGQRGFSLRVAGVDPLGDDYVLEITPPGAAEPIAIVGVPPAPQWPREGLDVFPALYAPEDAPAGFEMSLAPFTQADPPSFITRGGMPQPISLAAISMEAADDSGLVAFLMLFGSAEEGLPLYNQVALHQQAEVVDGIGERAAYYAGPTHEGQREVVEGSFMSCNAVFFLEAAADRGVVLPDRDEIIDYMRRVDARVGAGCGTRKSGTP